MDADNNIMVFRPTMEEFRDFNRYIHYMESQGAHKAGIAKIIPPKEWVPRKCYDNIDNFIIPAPINQVVNGQKGLFTQYNIQKKPMTVKEFRRLTNLPRYEPPFHENYDQLERIYWKNITFNPPIYGADISGTLYDKGVNVWNIGHLNTLLDVIELQSGVKIEGVNTAYLYFGMWKTTFAWHTEDMDLYSINYVHFGAPKSWYGIPPEHGKRLERLAAGFFPNSKSNCSSFLRHKMTLISPSILRKYGIPVKKITQEAGEIMITFPYSYHAGFNHGFNCAESTNFASERWLNYGKRAEKCTCKSDTVTIDMDIFVKIFQPDQYEQWKRDKKGESVKFLAPEIPTAPSLTQPYISWKEKFKIYRKLQENALGRRDLTEKHSQESCSSRPKSPLKSPKKNKTEKKARRKCSGVIPLADDEKSCDEFDSNQCLFDRVKNRSRKLGRANDSKPGFDAISQSAIQDLNFNRASVFNGHNNIKKEPSPLERSPFKDNCTVKCETISITSLPVRVDEVTKSDLKGSSSNNNKRRLPISTKEPKKKVCSNVLLKVKDKETHDLETTSEASQQSKAATFKEEIAFNSLMSSLEPYCAVCCLFKPQFHTPQTNITCKSGLPSKLPAPPSSEKKPPNLRTAPLILEVCFASSATNACPLAVCQLLDDEGKSPFLKCCVCLVQVHMSCYGVAQHQPDTQWTCDRCMKRDWSSVCCMCQVRGGALKPVVGGTWAHIVCAISTPETYFEQTIKRSDINISDVPTKRLKLKCCYCDNQQGVCVQCCSTRCTTSFHITCAHATGIPIEAGNWPFPVYVYCRQHTLEKIYGKIKDKNLPLVEGESVVAKHKNSRFYYCVVHDTKLEKLYHVNFKDNSWSDNLLPQDIVSHNVRSDPPEIGTQVEVKWTDGCLYEAEYKGFSTNEVIQVEFLDGLLVDLDRADVFVEKEGIPKKILKKLSHSKPLIPK